MSSSDYTCCVCRERGKTLQIHHIDENPSNIVFGNLSTLCVDCHAKTQIKSGFGEKITAESVIAYRDEWLNQLDLRRNMVIKMAVKRSINKAGLSKQVEQCQSDSVEPAALEVSASEYITSIPTYKKALLNQAKPNWNSGDTKVMVQQSYDYIDSLKGILVVLSRYCSPKKFENKKPQQYFSEIIASRFRWHKITLDPLESDTEAGDQTVDILCGARVMADIEIMIENLAMGLVANDDQFDSESWSSGWSALEA